MHIKGKEKVDLMPSYALLMPVSYNHWPELCHMNPSTIQLQGFWESGYLAKKEHITMIGLVNHDLYSEAEHIATLNKLFNRNYLDDDPYYIRITISYFKHNCKNVLNE